MSFYSSHPFSLHLVCQGVWGQRTFKRLPKARLADGLLLDEATCTSVTQQWTRGTLSAAEMTFSKLLKLKNVWSRPWTQTFQREVGFWVLCLYFLLPSATSYLSQGPGPGPGAGDAVVTKADSEQVNQPRNTWFQLAISMRGRARWWG